MSGASTGDDLAAALGVHGVEPDAAQRLARYGALLLEANANVNLTGARTADALVPHLLDAVALAPLVAGGEELVDVGSGGGLPGIPLALMSGVRLTLLEPIAKKAAFLRVVLEAVAMPGRVLAVRAEIAGRESDLRERFDVATARAVGSAPTVAELCLPLLRVGGRFLMQRGALSDRERQALDDAVTMLGGEIESETLVYGELRVVLVRKIAHTPPRFPRRNGVPAKRPLCL